MFVEIRFDVGCESAVDAKGLVIGGCHNTLGSEGRVLQKDARLLIVRPMEGRVGVAVAFHLITFQSVDLFRSDIREVVNVLRSLFSLNILFSLAKSLSTCMLFFSVS